MEITTKRMPVSSQKIINFFLSKQLLSLIRISRLVIYPSFHKIPGSTWGFGAVLQHNKLRSDKTSPPLYIIF